MYSSIQSRVAGLFFLSLFLAPALTFAQQTNQPDCPNTADSMDQEVTMVPPDDMPIYNPKAEASITIQCPPDDLEYEMPNLVNDYWLEFTIPTDLKGNKVEGETLSDPQ